MDSMEEGAGVWLIGTAQPIIPAAKDPGYTGTMMTPTEQVVFANTVSSGMNKLPMVIDHAGFTTNEGGQLPNAEQIIGHALEAWHDPQYGLMIAAFIPKEREEAGRFVRSITERGETQGFSLYTDTHVRGGDLITGDVEKIAVTHVGLTKSPAWKEEGSMVNEFSDQPFTLRQTIRDKYLSRPGAHFPEDWRRRLAETESADRKLIAERRAARQKEEERRTFFYSISAMADAKTDPAPPADPMVVDPPAKPAAPPPETPITDYIKRWTDEFSNISSDPNLQARWERVVTLWQTMKDTSKGSHSPFDWYSAGLGDLQKRVEAEKKVPPKPTTTSCHPHAFPHRSSRTFRRTSWLASSRTARLAMRSTSPPRRCCSSTASPAPRTAR